MRASLCLGWVASLRDATPQATLSAPLSLCVNLPFCHAPEMKHAEEQPEGQLGLRQEALRRVRIGRLLKRASAPYNLVT